MNHIVAPFPSPISKPVDTHFTHYIPKTVFAHIFPLEKAVLAKFPATRIIHDQIADQIEPVLDESDNMPNPNDVLLDYDLNPEVNATSKKNPVPTEVSRMELDHHDEKDRARTLRIACMHNGMAESLAYWYKKRPVPYLSTVILREYQVRIMNWMALREKHPVHGIRGGFVAPEMGLGKTITFSSYCLWSEKCAEGPTLIVASLNVLSEWRKHFAKFYDPDMFEKRVVILHKSFNPTMSKLRRVDFQHVDIVLTTYEMVQTSYRHLLKNYPDDADSCIQYRNQDTRKQILYMHVRTANSVRLKENTTGVNLIHQGMSWGRLACDESQTIANPTSKNFRAIMAVAAPRRWGISGTMVRNYVHDIWAQLRYVGYNKVPIKRMWSRVSAPRYYKTHGLSAVIYALTYEQAGEKLPTFHEENIRITLDERSREIYDLVEAKARKTYQLVLEKQISPASIRVMIMRLRQCCTAATIMNGHGAIDAILNDVEMDTESFLHAEYESRYEEDEDGADMMNVDKNDEVFDSHYDDDADDADDDDDEKEEDDDDDDGSMAIKVLRGTKRVNARPHGDERQTKRIKKEEDAPDMAIVIPKLTIFNSNKEMLEFCIRTDGEGGILSAKNRAAVAVVIKHLARGPQHKIICFSMFTKALELLIQALSASPALRGVDIIMVDGKVVGQDRDMALNTFRDKKTSRVLCLQGKVGGEGLNLQFATGGLGLEPHWTYQSKKQQRRRFWRLGQTEETWWYDIIVENTIEQRVIKICEDKIKIEEEFQNRKRGRPTAPSQVNFYGQLLGM
jgi:SNF2 family DNA or RNA helicase